MLQVNDTLLYEPTTVAPASDVLGVNVNAIVCPTLRTPAPPAFEVILVITGTFASIANAFTVTVEYAAFVFPDASVNTTLAGRSPDVISSLPDATVYVKLYVLSPLSAKDTATSTLFTVIAPAV